MQMRRRCSASHSSYARLRWADLIRHGAAPKAQHRATFPKGKAKRCVTSVHPIYKNVPRPAAHLNAPKGRASLRHSRASYAEGVLHAPKARFMRRRRASCAEGALHAPKARFIAAQSAATTPQFFALKGQKTAPLAQGSQEMRFYFSSSSSSGGGKIFAWTFSMRCSSVRTTVNSTFL